MAMTPPAGSREDGGQTGWPAFWAERPAARAGAECVVRLANAFVTRRPPSIHMLSAIDAHRRSGDEAGFLAAQEGDAAGDLARLAEAADGDFGDDLFQHRGGDRGDHVGVDIAGGDRVDRHALLGAFRSEEHTSELQSLMRISYAF